MVISWILDALFKSIGRSVIYYTSAHHMWNELEQHYGVSNGAQLFDLHKELNVIYQGNQNIDSYFTKIKMLWDDIESLCLIPICTCGCACDIDKKLTQFQQDQRVIQFLMGLNDSYATTRGSIHIQVYCQLLVMSTASSYKKKPNDIFTPHVTFLKISLHCMLMLPNSLYRSFYTVSTNPALVFFS